MTFSLYKYRRKFTNDGIFNGLIDISKCNRDTVLVINNKDLFSDLIFSLGNDSHNKFSIFNKWLREEDNPPLELLWRLEKEGLLKFTTFLYFHEDYCKTVILFIRDLLCNGSNVGCPEKTIVTDILYSLLKVKNNSDFEFLFEEVVQNTVLEAIKSFESSSFCWNYFFNLNNIENVDRSLIKEFALLNINKFLTSDNRHDILFVIGHHPKLWTLPKLSVETKTFFYDMVSVLGRKTVMNEVNDVVIQENFNWKYLLIIISVFVENMKNSESMKGAVDSWIKSALEEKNKTLLLTALIVARQCCTEKARYFTNYPTWFGSLPLKSVASFTFFFRCLSQIVPNEPPLFLKIHVNKVPSAPSTCQAQMQDYLALARTRLLDLKETTDYIGLFGDYHETDEEGQESDVQRAITLFQESKEIPKPLLEAAVFRKQYYEKTFLKRLLSASAVGDPRRVELIKKLQSVGKIPSALYRSWSSLSLEIS